MSLHYEANLMIIVFFSHSRNACLASYMQSIVFQEICIETDDMRSVLLKKFLLLQSGEGIRNVKRGRRIANIF